MTVSWILAHYFCGAVSCSLMFTPMTEGQCKAVVTASKDIVEARFMPRCYAPDGRFWPERK